MYRAESSCLFLMFWAGLLASFSGIAAESGDRTDFWSFKLSTKPAVPRIELRRWVRNPIDYFVAAKLAEKQMHPSREADRRTLLRRMSFDLTGLPPSPMELEQFLNDG